MKKLGIIHTTPATIDGLNRLAEERMEDIQIINILDDSILGDMRESREVDYVRERWIGYARNLERMGASVILSACSTVGEFAEEADQLLKAKVCRIDEAMAEKAVAEGSVISVFATLNSTLKPTVNLVQKKAREAGKEIEIHTVLVEGAYEALMKGHKEEHDARILREVEQYMENSHRIVLAQASMASAIPKDAEGAEKILTSPELGMDRIKELFTRGN